MAASDNTDQNVILFLFIGLAVGALTTHLLSTVGKNLVPYTVIVFIEGIILAALNKSLGLGVFGDSIHRWLNINASLILYVFLPALLFGEVMNLNWRQVQGGFAQSLLLAGPGVIIGAYLMGGFIYWVFPSWSWNLSMVFGSILSATDPVAVVALLKETGASSKLTIVIIGESLMNDGAAIVLFTLFYNMLKGTSYDFSGVLLFFIEQILGSPAMGFGFGIITVQWLRQINRPLVIEDTIIQIALTICCAYISYFLAQYYGLNGVLSCCAAGVCLAAFAQPLILNHEFMHYVWSMMEWIGNTIIFLLAGLILGDRALNNIPSYDGFVVICLYLVLMIIRAFIIIVFYPVLSTIGHKCTISEAIFMCWGGLRGALGIILALIIYIEREELGISERQADEQFFFVGGIATLTLLVNATSTQQVLLYLKLIGIKKRDKSLVLHQLRKRMRKRMENQLEAMRDFSNKSGHVAVTALQPRDLEEIRQLCSIFQSDEDAVAHAVGDTVEDGTEARNPRAARENLSIAVEDETEARRTEASRGNLGVAGGIFLVKRVMNFFSQSSTAAPQPRISVTERGMLHDDLLVYIRTIFLEIVRVRYWYLIEEGKLPRLSFSAKSLLYSIDAALDDVHVSPLSDIDIISREIEANRSFLMGILDYLDRYTPGSVTFFRYYYGWVGARKENRAVYMLTSFIEAHEHAQSRIHAFTGSSEEEGDFLKEERQRTVESPIDGANVPFSHYNLPSAAANNNDINTTPMEPLRTPEEIKVLEESKSAVAKAKMLLGEINSDSVRGIVTKQAARSILAKQTHMIKEMVKEGLLSVKDAEEFLTEIGKDTAVIEKIRNKMNREHSMRAASSKHDPEMSSSFWQRSDKNAAVIGPMHK